MANPPYVPGGMKPGVAKTVKPKVVAAPHQAKPAKAAPNPTGGVNSGAGAKPSTGGAGLFGGLGPEEYIRRLYAPQEDAAKNLFGGLDPGDFIAKLFAPQESAVNNMFGGLSPQDYVQQIYAPQLQMLQQQQGLRSGAFAGMVKDFLSSLNNVGEQLQPYTNAASQQTSDANNAAASLAAANPNAVTQSDLAAVNAPQAQRDQVAQQNSTAFGGNAALLRYAGGVIPSDQFRSNAASRAAYLATLPAIGESIGVRGFTALANLASKELGQLSTSEAQTLAEAVQSQGSARVSLASSKAGALSDAVQSAGKMNLQIAGNKTSDLLKARNDLASYVQGNQKLKAAAAKTAFDQNFKVGQANERVDEFNAKQTLAGAKFGLDQQVAAFNQKYKVNTYNLSVSRLNQSANKFAYQQMKDNRSYTLQLKKFGLSKAASQRAAIAQEYKLKSGGFTPTKINEFKTSARYVQAQVADAAQRADAGQKMKDGSKWAKPTLTQAMGQMAKRHVPLSIAIPALRAAGYTIPTAQQSSDYNRMTGVSSSGPLAGPYGKITVAPGADRPGASTSSAVKAFVAHIAHVAGVPLTITTGTHHNEYVLNTHRVSDHWAGNASDILYGHGVPGRPDPALTRLGQDALIAAGANPAWARRQTGGLFNFNTKAGRIQVIFNSMEGGNHYNHLHVGVRP